MKKLFILILGFSALAMGQSEDIAANPGSGQSRAVSDIGAFTVDSVVHDFDVLSVGPTTVTDIQNAFPGSAVGDITTVPGVGTLGSYGYQNASGNALAADPDGSGNLAIISSVDGPFGFSDSIFIDLLTDCTQFGIGIGDWSGPININFFDGAANVGTIQIDTTTGSAAGTPGSWHVLESTVPFNRVEVTAFPDNPGANWVIHQFATEMGYSVPTLSEWGFGIFTLMLVIGALFIMRRRLH